MSTPQETVGLREFLRGGYRKIQRPVMVMNRKKPVAEWIPIQTQQPNRKEMDK